MYWYSLSVSGPRVGVKVTAYLERQHCSQKIFLWLGKTPLARMSQDHPVKYRNKQQ